MSQAFGGDRNPTQTNLAEQIMYFFKVRKTEVSWHRDTRHCLSLTSVACFSLHVVVRFLRPFFSTLSGMITSSKNLEPSHLPPPRGKDFPSSSSENHEKELLVFSALV